MKIVSVEEMQAIEKHADLNGLSYNQMMHNAGGGITSWLLNHVAIFHGAVGLIGSGNNGGDALIALTGLAQHGIRTLACLVKNRSKDDLLEAYLRWGGTVVDLTKNQRMAALEAALNNGMTLLDGILGTGLKLPLRGDLAGLMGKISTIVKKCSRSPIVAIDCPSGVDCDSGIVADVTIRADFTLCMAAIKKGLLKQPGRSFCGEFNLINIGLSKETKQLMDGKPKVVDLPYVSKHLPTRSDIGHKGTFGTCQVVAGSRSFTGACYLAGKAAYSSGCGLVDIGAIEEVYHNVSGQLIEAVWTILPAVGGAYADQGLPILKSNIEKADALVLGPGMGFCHENVTFVSKLLRKLPPELSTVIDADGLNLLAEIDCWWDKLPQNTILTPHPGEMSTLTGISIKEIQENRWKIAVDYAQKWGVVLVLKGAMTVIASPVERWHIIPVSDSSLATAGSGDVLAGLIGGLFAQGVSAKEAAICGAWLHAQAGLFAKKRFGTAYCVTALDILEALPTAFLKIKQAGR